MGHYKVSFLQLIIPSLLLFLSISQLSTAQDITASSEFRRIKSLNDFWYIKLISTQKDLTVSFADKNLSETSLDYNSNIGNFAGFGIFAFDVGLEFTFRTPPSPEQNELYGPSKARDYQIHLYTRKIGADFIYQDYEGMYLSNPINYFPDWEDGDRFPRMENLRVQVLSAAMYYVFKPDRYSFPSVFNQTEIQLKTGGSWLISGRINHSEISDPNNILPITDSNQLTGVTNLNNVRVTSFNVLPGYSLNIIMWKKYYLNFSLSLGAGYQIRSYNNDEFYRDNSIEIANTWRIGAGYNGKRFFAGLSGFTQTNNTTIQNLEVSTRNGFVKLFIGYRFAEKGFMKRSVYDLLNVFSKKNKTADQ